MPEKKLQARRSPSIVLEFAWFWAVLIDLIWKFARVFRSDFQNHRSSPNVREQTLVVGRPKSPQNTQTLIEYVFIYTSINFLANLIII